MIEALLLRGASVETHREGRTALHNSPPRERSCGPAHVPRFVPRQCHAVRHAHIYMVMTGEGGVRKSMHLYATSTSEPMTRRVSHAHFSTRCKSISTLSWSALIVVNTGLPALGTPQGLPYRGLGGCELHVACSTGYRVLILDPDVVQCIVEIAAVWQHHLEGWEELLFELLVRCA